MVDMVSSTQTMNEESSHNRANKPEESKRSVDNEALAAMLRESASFVERGAWDPILYQALSEFRLYYKEKVPKRKDKTDEKSRKRHHKKKVISTTTTHVPANVTKSSTKSSEAPAEKSPGDGITTATTKTAAIAENKTPAVDAPKTVGSEAKLEPNDKTVLRKQNPVESRVEEPPNVPSPAAARPVSLSRPTSPQTNKTSIFRETTTASPSPSTMQKHMGGALFGKIKFPKLNVNIPNPHFAATSKKNAQRAKEDFEEMISEDVQNAEALIQGKESGWFPSFPVTSKKSGKAELEEIIGEQAPLAESSSRRKVPGQEVPSSHTFRSIQQSKTNEPGSWCEVHFTKGCECQEAKSKTTSGRGPDADATTSTTSNEIKKISPLLHEDEKKPAGAFSVSETNNATIAAGNNDPTLETTQDPKDDGNGKKMQHQEAKPAFQKPVNKSSSLIANGWIEQQRRSKMRSVWKEVLASLVLGRKAGEETTLWIQREITNVVTGKKELEALHQIPVKFLQEVTYLDYTADNRFTLKLLNQSDDFIFRCNSDIAAMNWVMTLKKVELAVKAGTSADERIPKEKPSWEEEKKGSDSSPSYQQPEAQPEAAGLTVRDLRAICHGAGINTMGMERGELEAAATEVRKRGTFFPPQSAKQPTTTPTPAQTAPPPVPAAQPSTASSTETAVPTEGIRQEKISISELRAICHGAGINTSGMERSELEKAAEAVRKRGTYFDPPTKASAPTNDLFAAAHEELKKQDDLRTRQDEVRRQEDLRARQEEMKKQEELRRRQEIEEQKMREAVEAKRKVEEERRRIAEEEARRRHAEEENRRRQQEEEIRRQQQARYAEQQTAWKKQQQEEESRRRMAEQQAAEQRRRHDEALRKQQQWASQQQQQQWAGQQKQQQTPWGPHQAPPQQPHQQTNWHQHQTKHQTPQPQQRHQTPPPHSQHAPQQQWNQQQQHNNQDPHSAVNEKYAKMANQAGDNGQAAITRIKHDILIHWALQPPQLQMLRPIDTLVTTIHNIFPPKLGVRAHVYFEKWKPINRSDILGDSGMPEGDKLKKSVRKIRFFLHPDKLPADLNPEQQFLVKMLWDVTSDAWEEFEKHQADLDWIK